MAVCSPRPYPLSTCSGVNRESVATTIPTRGGLMRLDFITNSGYDAVTGQNTTDLLYPQLGCNYFPYTSTLVLLLGLGAPPGSDAVLGVLFLSPY